jgi:hypothetical protein
MANCALEDWLIAISFFRGLKFMDNLCLCRGTLALPLGYHRGYKIQKTV